jgi:hypothetical protein
LWMTFRLELGQSTGHIGGTRTDFAILLGAALIGAVILFIFRYDVTNNPGGTYRLNRWTGAVERCMFWGGIDDKKITCQ